MRPLALALALAGSSVATGCATVRPWEREALAAPAMAEEPSPEGAAFDAHFAGAREGALDPGTAGGGGCGCN